MSGNIDRQKLSSIGEIFLNKKLQEKAKYMAKKKKIVLCAIYQDEI